jgi:hypothetical protein
MEDFLINLNETAILFHTNHTDCNAERELIEVRMKETLYLGAETILSTAKVISLGR